MNKNLLIVFAKNKLYGKVKTRLAKTIGDQSAYEVYARLFEITETESCKVSNADVTVYYSHSIDADSWVGYQKFVQEGETLGDRLLNAFEAGFKKGYERIIGIGADLAEINAGTIENAFVELENNDFVIGPAEDGGYYLIGVGGEKGNYIFKDKPWSTESLLDITKNEIESKGDQLRLLHTLNDIDTIEDLEKSTIASEFEVLIAKAKG